MWRGEGVVTRRTGDLYFGGPILIAGYGVVGAEGEWWRGGGPEGVLYTVEGDVLP